MVGSYFDESSFTTSGDEALAPLSIGVTSRRTCGSSQCFCQDVPGGILISIKHTAALLADKDTIGKRLIVISPPTSRAGFA
jgi:hypothetical protein